MLSEQLGALEFYGGITAIVGLAVRLAKPRLALPGWAWPLIASLLSFLLVGGDALAGGDGLAAAAWAGLAGLFAGPLAAGTHETAKAILDPALTMLTGDVARARDLRIKILGHAKDKAEAKAGKTTAASLVLVVLLFLPVMGCGATVQEFQVTAATTMGNVTNAAAQRVAADWEDEGDAIVESGKPVPEIEEELEAHESRYREIWRALNLVSALHDTWATALEEGDGDLSLAILGKLHDAYCAARVFVDELPQIAAMPCSEVSP